MIVRAPPPRFDCQFDGNAPTPASAPNNAPQTKRTQDSTLSGRRGTVALDADRGSGVLCFLFQRADLKNIFVSQHSDGSDAPHFARQ
jgi:hypothetical protein